MSSLDAFGLARAEAEKWMDFVSEASLRNEIAAMLADQSPDGKEALLSSFSGSLPFGTGGLRGRLGIGPARINTYTIGRATQGFSHYVQATQSPRPLANDPHSQPSYRVVIAYDSRHQSPELAHIAAQVLQAHNISAYLFSSLRPTPLLSYAVRVLDAHGGIVITASHNPSDYNGYKVYRSDGSQIVSPEDKSIMGHIEATAYSAIRFGPSVAPLHRLGPEMDVRYFEEMEALFKAWRLHGAPNAAAFAAATALKILYTPLHGAGLTLVPVLLKRLGYDNVSVLSSQSQADGDFPTVPVPNPEEAAALAPALAEAKHQRADLVLANDPDADRLGVIIRHKPNEYIRLDGNQIGALLTDALLGQLPYHSQPLSHPFIVKTIVTSPLIAHIAAHYGVPCYEVPTGFKYIAQCIRAQAGHFVLGVEESYGYLVGDSVRDKDGVAACGWIAAIASRAKNRGHSLWDQLLNIYAKVGFVQDSLYSLTLEGQRGQKQIQQLMNNLRQKPPLGIAGEQVLKITDYLTPKKNANSPFPPIDMLAFALPQQGRLLIRPSGTEPKIKCYCSLQMPFPGKESFADAQQKMIHKAQALQQDLLQVPS